MIISLIVVVDNNNAIGYQNQLLTHLPADLKYFKGITTGHHIVMGRKTYESIGKPLPNRINVVISRDTDLQLEGCIVVQSLNEAIALAGKAGETELMITGGGVIFEQALTIAHKIYLTRIFHTFEADTYFPQLGPEWEQTKDDKHEADEKNLYPFSFQVYERKN